MVFTSEALTTAPNSLYARLALVPDPRKVRGIRHLTQHNGGPLFLRGVSFAEIDLGAAD